ncbi:MAG: hypothetical protein EP344_04550 [Bacteroidetes bacterium]|nr:MAG: hypothetical protein EP344_04550 [Bacteroidota bacterium]
MKSLKGLLVRACLSFICPAPGLLAQSGYNDTHALKDLSPKPSATSEQQAAVQAPAARFGKMPDPVKKWILKNQRKRIERKLTQGQEVRIRHSDPEKGLARISGLLVHLDTSRVIIKTATGEQVSIPARQVETLSIFKTNHRQKKGLGWALLAIGLISCTVLFIAAVWELLQGNDKKATSTGCFSVFGLALFIVGVVIVSRYSAKNIYRPFSSEWTLTEITAGDTDQQPMDRQDLP